MDEGYWLHDVQQYDPDALGEIYSRFSRPIYDYVYRWTGDQTLSETLTNEVFMHFLDVVATFDEQASLRVELYRIAGDLVDEHLRRPSRRPNDLKTEEDGYSNLRKLIQQLPTAQQQCLILKMDDDLSDADIANIIGTTERAIPALQHQALAGLARVREGK